MNDENRRITRRLSSGWRLRPQVEPLELRPLMSYPAFAVPGYVYGYASLGGTPQAQTVPLSQSYLFKDLADVEPPAGSSLDFATTSLDYEDDDTGELVGTSSGAYVEIHTRTDSNVHSGASAVGYTTATPNSNPPGQNLVPVQIEPSGGTVAGQAVSVTLKAQYYNTNIISVTGSNTYVVQYQVGGTTHTMMNAVDTQMIPGAPTVAQTASFTATVGATFYVYLYLASATGAGGAPAGDLRLDMSVTDQGGGGGGGAPISANYTVSVAGDQTLQVAAPGILTSASDPAGLPLHVVSYGNPSHGTLTVYSDGAFTYVPSANYTGSDAFGYTIADSAGQSSSGAVVITVAPPTPAEPSILKSSVVKVPAGSTPSGLTPAELALLLLMAGESPVDGSGARTASQVISVSKLRSHRATKGLIVAYSSNNGLGNAGNAGDYIVAVVSKRGKKMGKVQPVRSVSYDAASHMATISLARKIPGNPRLRLSIIGVLPSGPYTATL